MAQKIKPTALRTGVTKPWASRWFFTRKTRFFLEEDLLIREFVTKKMKDAGIAELVIERSGDAIRVHIVSARPGLIIGRGGKGIEDMKEELVKKLKALRKENGVAGKFVLNLNVEELGRNEVSAAVVAQQIASDIEKRQPYRKTMKRTIENVMMSREVGGVKIRLSGRLNGAEISRTEWLAKGRMPLQTLRANIDYAEAISYNTYGTIGVKVWIYKGDVFEAKTEAKKK